MSRAAAFTFVTAAAAAMTGCASTGATPRPFPSPVPSTTSAAPAAGTPASKASRPAAGHRGGYEVAGTALSLRGAPYRTGGSDPAGFDCSGFVRYVFGEYGLALPREVREQFRVGKSVGPDRLAPGDLVFFTTVAPGASHVGIAIGGGRFVHAPSEKGVVRVEALSTRYWAARFVGAKRVGK